MGLPVGPLEECMSDPVEEVYGKYLESGSRPPERDLEAEIMAQESEAPCPMCGSQNVDHSRGYRGEYRCLKCGHTWQVGGKDAKF